MIIDTNKIRQELKTYETRKRELIGEDKEQIHELLMELEELNHELKVIELINERFKNMEDAQ